jgi:hypothetical protein
MKDEFGRIVAVEIRYIKIEYRRTAESRFDLTPAIVKIVKPRIPTPRKSTADTSVHWSDIHFPHHDERALSILHQVISMVDPVVVVDHGDTLDAEQLGRWAKNPLARVSLKEEIHMGINHFGEVTSLVRQDCRKIWLEGNHEERKRRIARESGHALRQAYLQARQGDRKKRRAERVPQIYEIWHLGALSSAGRSRR